MTSPPPASPDCDVAAPPVVLVTGAAKRLGREIALTLARAGWRVAVHYGISADDAIKTVADCEELTRGAMAFCGDLGNELAVVGLVPEVAQKMGCVDAVVNSAALFEYDNASSFSPELLAQQMAVNLTAPSLLAKSLHAHWSARASNTRDAATGRRHGVVVNLLDQKLFNPNPDFFSYTLTKAALASATTLMAQGLAPLLRVVGIAPGLTLTSKLLTDEQFDALHHLSPLGHSSSAADVAATVRFALENESITGTTLLVDGGQHLMRFDRDFSMMPQGNR